MDRANTTRSQCALHYKHWLSTKQKLLLVCISYCTLHISQSHRVTAALMELLLLQAEVQQGHRRSELVSGNEFFI